MVNYEGNCREIIFFWNFPVTCPCEGVLISILLFQEELPYPKPGKNGMYQLLRYRACTVDILKFQHSCLPKDQEKTGQTQIRLLLKKQSDQGLPCSLS